MKNTLWICAVALATTYGCASTPADPAAGATTATAPVEATTAATPAEEVKTPSTSSQSESKLVCESVANTGTRLATRSCKSHAQIEAERQNAKDTTNIYQRDGLYQKEKGN
jgi:hypothetical protein